MTHSTDAVGPLLFSLLLGVAFLLCLDCPSAHAHGGRIKPPPIAPGDRGPPRRPPPPPPPPIRPGDSVPKPPPPTTPPPTSRPGDAVPVRPPPTTPRSNKPTTPTVPPTAPPTTGGGNPTPPPTPGTLTGRPAPRGPKTNRPGGRRTAATSPEMTWQHWWALNRWTYFPERGAQWIRKNAIVTPSGDPEGGLIDPRVVAATRRQLVTKQHILPFLLKQLEPERSVRPEVRAATLLAIAKLSNDETTVRLLFRFAEDERRSNLVRESAALAVGMLRRGAAAHAMDGGDLDAARERLLLILDDNKAAQRTRAFAALSLGMLGSQPFGTPFSKDGRVITRALWQRLQKKYAGREIPVALLTALGMQPAAGTSQEIQQALFRITSGRRVGRRSWDALERSHALSALIRQQGTGWSAALSRLMTDKRLATSVRRAAFIAMGARRDDFTPATRLEALDSTMRGLRLARDPLTRGLGSIAVGRLLGADLRAHSLQVLERTGATGHLLGEARHGSRPHRGFAVIALALSLREAKAKSVDVAKYRVAATALLLRGLERTKDASLRGSYAVALGLLGPGTSKAEAPLTALLIDRNADPALRGHAALALAQLGAKTGGVRKALRTALWDRRSVDLRSQAALALAFLGGASDTKMLVGELRRTGSQWVLAQVAAALGQLGDLSAVTGILDVAGDPRREDETRALAIASLGLLADPEPKPSMLHLTSDSNYPAKTDALYYAFSIL